MLAEFTSILRQALEMDVESITRLMIGKISLDQSGWSLWLLSIDIPAIRSLATSAVHFSAYSSSTEQKLFAWILLYFELRRPKSQSY